MFAEKLRRLRLAAGLTQQELAERAQLSERAVRALELGSARAPRMHTVRALAGALALSEDDSSVLLEVARPSPAPAGADASNLPRFLTAVIGRQDEIETVRLMLEERRLITLVGPGGVGKTRLALAVAENLVNTFDRTFFVELASVRDAVMVPRAIASCIGTREAPDQPILDRITADLAPARVLLLLDNLEHVIAAAAIIPMLLSRCPRLKLLTTSREPLRLRGERIYTVGPLTLPDREMDIAASPAVKLFVERARDAGGKLPGDRSDWLAVADICRRLDGLPLAIELAAAWTTVLSPAALAERLTTRLPHLDHGAQDLPPRQRTMRDAIAWSFTLLSLEEQSLFARLSVFSGGFTIEAVQAVCGGPDAAEPWQRNPLALLRSLVAKSLLTVHDQEAPDGPSRPRFGMLETVREFAHEELLKRPEAEETVRRHAAYFVLLVESARPRLRGMGQAGWLLHLEIERDNLRTALRTAQSRDDVELGLRLAGGLWPFWLAHSHLEEANSWLQVFLQLTESSNVPASIHAYARLAAGELANMQIGNETSIRHLEHALALSQQAHDDACIGAVLQVLGEAERSRGNYPKAESMFEEALTLYRRLPDPSGLCAVLAASAGVARYQGYYERATILFEEALELSRAAGDLRRVADVLARTGNMATEMGRPELSGPRYQEALSLFRQIGDTYGIADVLYRRGETDTQCGRCAEAMESLDESLLLYRSLGAGYGASYALLHKGEAAIGLGDLDGAEEMIGESLASFQALDDRRCIGFAFLYLGDAARARGDHDRAKKLYRESLRLHLALNTRPPLTRCLERIACLAAGEGRFERAALLHGAAASLRESMKTIQTPAERDQYEPCMQRASQELGSDVFENVVSRGQLLGAGEAAGFALAD